MNALITTIIIALSLPPHGDLHDRIKELDVALSKEPRSIELLMKRGELHRMHGEFPKALRDLHKAKDIDPKRVEIDLLEGRLLIDMKKHRAAEKSLRRFLEARPRHTLGLRLAAMNERLRGDFGGASKYLLLLLQDSKGATPQDVLHCAEALKKSKKKESKRALLVLNRELEKRGPVIALELAALSLEKELCRYQAALQRVERLAKGQKRQDTWSMHKAEIFLLQGKRIEAEAAMRKALQEIAQLPMAVRRRPAIVKQKQSIVEKLARPDVSLEK